jgi:6-phosphofructokinase 1
MARNRDLLRFRKKSFPVVGVASTIDNDLCGSEITIGVDTALNIALEAIDRIKVTASSHERAFLMEVMGRNCGHLALAAGIAGARKSCCSLPPSWPADLSVWPVQLIDTIP